MLISELPDTFEKTPIHPIEGETVTDRTRSFGTERFDRSASEATGSVPYILRPERSDTSDERYVMISDVSEGCLDRTAKDIRRSNSLGTCDAMGG